MLTLLSRGTPRESHLTVSKNAVCVDGDKNDVNDIIDLRRVSNLRFKFVLSLELSGEKKHGLECAVYGEGTVFSVKVKRDAKVEALQEAIFDKKRYKERYSFDASALTLYLAKKWLKHDYSVEELLQGKIDTGYKKMLSSWILDEDYFGAEFEPGRKKIHVLVELLVPDSHCVDIGEPDPRLVKYQRKYSL
ncbi:unnamed protein product [Phytophthora lilii]|uniref:Unnamed protein product n=1 Tax=Phytophthora lilii TaxID=2077276 RepID=A0A9W6YIG8_9STRA|nr:unnamed protein product [Phytophthora lilii]